MKNTYIPILIIISLALNSLSAQNKNPIDTLKRELLLEKEYIPTGQKVKKEFFNPLPSKISSDLTPISFIKDSYSVTTKYNAKDLGTQENRIEPEIFPQKGYVQLNIGMPLEYRLKAGIATSVGEESLLSAYLSHNGLKYQHDIAIPILPSINRNESNSECLVSLQTPLYGTLFNFSIQGLLNNNPLYGIVSLPVVYTDKEILQSPSIPILKNRGLVVNANFIPTTLFTGSDWLAKGNATLSIMDKNEVPSDLQEVFNNNNSLDKASELNAFLDASLMYKFTEFVSGDISADIQINHIGSSKLGTLNRNRVLFSVTPSILYKSENITANAGLKVFSSTGIVKGIRLAPELYFNYLISPMFSLNLYANGGSYIPTFYNVYKNNPFLNITSNFSEAINTTDYTIGLGGTIGNINGFSIDIDAGFSKLAAFTGYQTSYFVFSDNGADYKTSFTEGIVYEDVNRTFVHTSFKYKSPFNFTLKGYANVDSYSIENNKLLGIPYFNMGLIGSYMITPKFNTSLIYRSFSGINYNTPDGNLNTLPQSHILDLSASYNINRNISLSLQANNVLNLRNERWYGYNSKPITLLGGININF